MIKLSDIFKCEKCSPVHANKIKIYDEFSLKKKLKRYISRTVKNNGIKGYTDYINKKKINKPMCITIPMNGEGLLTPKVQTKKFYAANLVCALYPLAVMTKNELVFYAAAIEKHRYKFSSHGREVNTKRLMDIIVPKYKNEKPSKKIKEFSIATSEIFNERINTILKSNKKIFKIDDIFVKIRNGKIKINQHLPGKTPVVSSSEKFGGITKFIDAPPEFEFGFTISNNGSICYFNYQKQPFCATPDITIFQLKNKIHISKSLIAYLKIIIEKNQFKFNYGRKLKTRFNEIEIYMPITKDGKINWKIFNENKKL